MSSKCGQINQVVLCERVTTGVHIIDPRTGQRGEFTQVKFWNYGPFSPIAVSPQMIEFIVLDCELLDEDRTIRPAAIASGSNNKRKRGDEASAVMMATPSRRRGVRLGVVELVKVTDFGLNDIKYTCTTHMGHLLHAGDHVMGYSLDTVNYNPSDKQGLDVRFLILLFFDSIGILVYYSTGYYHKNYL